MSDLWTRYVQQIGIINTLQTIDRPWTIEEVRAFACLWEVKRLFDSTPPLIPIDTPVPNKGETKN